MSKTIQLTTAERYQLLRMLEKDREKHGHKKVWQELHKKLKKEDRQGKA